MNDNSPFNFDEKLGPRAEPWKRTKFRSPLSLYCANSSPLRQPNAPDVPPSPLLDPVATAYQAGRDDAMAERYRNADRIIPRPAERPLAREIELPCVDERYG